MGFANLRDKADSVMLLRDFALALLEQNLLVRSGFTNL